MTKHYTSLPEQLRLAVWGITEQVKWLLEEDGITDFDLTNEISEVENAVLQLLNKSYSPLDRKKPILILTDHKGRFWKKHQLFPQEELDLNETPEEHWMCLDCKKYFIANNVRASIVEPISESDKNILIQHMNVHICKETK